jgi:Zn-dependent peptidase ImmA (M78 family)
MTKQLKPKIFFNNEIIEKQVICDLISFQKTTKKKLVWPIDLELFVKNLWGLNVNYLDEIKNGNSKDTIVGCLLVKDKCIQVNLSENKNDGRINFTIAHEAGHASLHSSLSILSTNEVVENIYCRELGESKDNNWRIEQQANCYAYNLLIPKNKLFEKVDPNSIIDLNTKSGELMQYFTVSRQALELRLYKLGFNTINNKYLFR